MIKTKNISEMLTSLIEEYHFNNNTLSQYLEITEQTIDGVVMGNVECLPDDPALRLKILSKVGFLYLETACSMFHHETGSKSERRAARSGTSCKSGALHLSLIHISAGLPRNTYVS